MFWIGFAVGVIMTNIVFLFVLALGAAAKRSEQAMLRESGKETIDG